MFVKKFISKNSPTSQVCITKKRILESLTFNSPNWCDFINTSHVYEYSPHKIACIFMFGYASLCLATRTPQCMWKISHKTCIPLFLKKLKGVWKVYKMLVCHVAHLEWNIIKIYKNWCFPKVNCDLVLNYKHFTMNMFRP